MIKAIVFDLWETLGTKEASLSGEIAKKFGFQKTKEFMAKYEKSVQLKSYRKKGDLARDFLKNFRLKINVESVLFIIKALDKSIEKAKMFEGMRELIVELSNKYSLGILSNTTSFESEIVKKWNVDEQFKACVFSWEICSLKPARKNYEEICKRLDVRPEEVVFIDDSEINVEAAKEFGMNGLWFRDFETLKETLSSFLDD